MSIDRRALGKAFGLASSRYDEIALLQCAVFCSMRFVHEGQRQCCQPPTGAEKVRNLEKQYLHPVRKLADALYRFHLGECFLNQVLQNQQSFEELLFFQSLTDRAE